MSKPVVRVVIAVLVCLAIVAAISPSVQAKLGSVFQLTEANTAASSTVIESQTLQEGTLNQPAPASPQFDKSGPSDSSHECNSDPSLDY
jgi:hypothetical protein